MNEKENPMAKSYDKDSDSARSHRERAATDDFLEKGSRAKFREFTNDSAKDVPSSLQPDDEGK
jgi:hypothetical protein